ncbi:ABC transporter substrate-binding protein [Sedimenticola sp.]|uniref:ABC transporter substrate-binding protein n=1 Tax=Sedimenticola sp. TaxID=1940285 RepID=UPI003D0B5999
MSARRCRKQLCAVLSMACMLLFTSHSFADHGNIVVFSSGTTPVYDQVATQLKHYLSDQCQQIIPDCIPHNIYLLSQAADGSSLVIPPKTKLIITLGLRAGEVMRNMNTGLPILHALISRSSYQKLASDINHSAIFLDQPITRQLQLAKIIRHDPHIGLLMSPITQPIRDELFEEALKQDIPISYRSVDSSEMVGPQLKAVLEESNILLALPDPTIFNRTTIFNILLSSYHNKTPVIGFSSAYVKAGALIAAYSTPEDIARHLAEYTSNYLNSGTGELPGPFYPKYFSVAVNQSVARSLGISLPEETDIIRQMLENSQP